MMNGEAVDLLESQSLRQDIHRVTTPAEPTKVEATPTEVTEFEPTQSERAKQS